jgi:hypothetical protein
MHAKCCVPIDNIILNRTQRILQKSIPLVLIRGKGFYSSNYANFVRTPELPFWQNLCKLH